MSRAELPYHGHNPKMHRIYVTTSACAMTTTTMTTGASATPSTPKGRYVSNDVSYCHILHITKESITNSINTHSFILTVTEFPYDQIKHS